MLWGLFYAVILRKRCFLVKNTLVYDEGILIASPRRPPFFGQSGGGSVKSLLKHVLPISSGIWWFLTAYFILFALIPGLNQIISRLTIKQLVLTTAGFWLFLNFALLLDIEVYERIRQAVFYYLVGAIVRKTDVKASKWLFLAVFLLAWLLYCAGGAFCAAKGINNTRADVMSYMSSGGTGKVAAALPFLCRAAQPAVLTPVASVACFLLFKRLNISQSRLINAISSTSLAVYVIHTGAGFLIWKIFRPLDVQYPSPLYPLLLVATCLAVFIGCSLIDLGRQWLFRVVASHLARKEG